MVDTPEGRHETDPPLSEEDRFKQEIRARTRQLDLEEREVIAKEAEVRRSRWLNPTVLGLFAAAIGLLGNVVVAYYNNLGSQQIERLRLQSNLIQEAVKSGPGGPEAACKNLMFLVRAGLVDDPKGTLMGCAKSPKDTLYVPTASSRTSRSNGTIARWNAAVGTGQISSAGSESQVFSFTVADCTQRLLAALHAKDIPPNSAVQVTFDESLAGEAFNVDLSK